MAPRLSRWIALTVVAAGMVATMLLTTGGPPLVVLWWGSFLQDEGERSQTSRRIAQVRSSLQSVQAELAALETREQVARITARTKADPLVLRRDGPRLVIDAPASAALTSLWSRIPTRRDDIRSVVIEEGPGSGAWARLGPDGVCVVRAAGHRSPLELQSDLRTTGGECLFAEEFGAPGKGVRTWQADGRSRLSWDRDRRSWSWHRRDAGPEERILPAWFQGGPDFLGWEYEWREVNRLEMACLLGRSDQCTAAAGVGEAGWPPRDRFRGFTGEFFPQASLPRDLRQALGPAKFGELWTSDRPIAESYAAATGTSMDGWIMEWARRPWGVIQRDNALTLVGWLGAFLWITLIALVVGQRLKQRAAT